MWVVTFLDAASLCISLLVLDVLTYVQHVMFQATFVKSTNLSSGPVPAVVVSD